MQLRFTMQLTERRATYSGKWQCKFTCMRPMRAARPSKRLHASPLAAGGWECLDLQRRSGEHVLLFYWQLGESRLKAARLAGPLQAGCRPVTWSRGYGCSLAVGSEGQQTNQVLLADIGCMKPSGFTTASCTALVESLCWAHSFLHLFPAGVF